MTSALWKQLLLESLSISLFLQEINTLQKVNGGFSAEAFTLSLFLSVFLSLSLFLSVRVQEGRKGSRAQMTDSAGRVADSLRRAEESGNEGWRDRGWGEDEVVEEDRDEEGGGGGEEEKG